MPTWVWLSADELINQREARAAADARVEAAETLIDDLKAEFRKEGEGRAKAEAKAELLQAEADRLRAEAEGLKAELADMRVGRRRWFRWRRV